MKYEMTAREYAKQRARLCKDRKYCSGCPLFKAAQENNLENGCAGLQLEYPDEAVRLVAEWAAAHPEETLEPLGDNIYFDPKHRIVPEEIVQVFTVEITSILRRGTDFTKAELVERARNVENAISDIAVHAGYLRPDDVKCIRAQQFITKCHEEEI